MQRPIHEQVVVITGASSGIGRETAIQMAQRGAAVVLAARSEPALRQLADEITASGGRCHVVPTDVANAGQINHLAQEAIRTFGRIDTWVNDAAVSEYALFEQMSFDEFERIVQVNLLGTVYGTRAAIEQMRPRGGGTIINIGSVLSDRAVPLQSAYVATKHAVKGFTDAVRLELDHENSGIQVTLILPTSINTPFFDHAKSKMGVKGKPIPPVYDPSVVADAIVHAAEHPIRELYIGGPAKFFSLMQRLSPALCDWWMKQGARMFEQQRSDVPDQGQDALHHPSAAHDGRSHGAVRGRFGDQAMKSSLYTSTFEKHPNVKRAVVGVMAIGAAAAFIAIGRMTLASRRSSRGKSALWERVKQRAHDARVRMKGQDPRVNLIRYGYAPVVRALQDAGVNPRSIPGFDHLSARLLTAASRAQRTDR